MAGTTTIQEPVDKVKKVYDAVSKKYDVGTLDEFKADMKDPKKNRKVYDVVSKDFDVGSYDTFQQDLGANGKKKDTGSVSPSASSPKPDQTGQPVNTGGSDPKQVSTNYKNKTLTGKDIPPSKDNSGISADDTAKGINNKANNLEAASNAPSAINIQNYVKEHQSALNELNQLNNRQAYVGDVTEDQLNAAKTKEQFYRSGIQKSYDEQKKKVVPELVSDLKTPLGISNWTDIYNKPEIDGVAGLKFKNPIQWNSETHKLTPQSVEWVAGHVDKLMNKKNNSVINAQVSGDLDDKKRTYEDLTRSVVDYLNTIPVQKKQQEFTDEFTNRHPELKDAFDANGKINDYFSKDNVDAVKARVNIERDKAIQQTGEKYFGKNGLFFSNEDFVGIQHKYAQLVSDGKMTNEVAKKQIEAETKQNPALKELRDNMDGEVRKIHEKTQKDFEKYMIDGLKKVNPRLTIYKDGSVGPSTMSEDKYKDLIKRYEGDLNDISIGMGMDSNEAWQKQANQKAKSAGAFGGSLGSSLNDLTGAFSKFWFNKTQWGQKNVQYYEAQDIASPNIAQSQVAAAWNWKGLESLKDPNFWLSKIGSMVPVIAGGSAVGLLTDGAGMPEYIGWLANAGLFTAQSGLSTYNQMLNTRDAQGNLLTEVDASHYMANQMSEDFLPNVLMMAATSGTLLRAKNIIKPTIGGTIRKGILGAVEAQPFFTWQGYNDYATSQEAQGKKTDFFDYMQSKDFKDNLINGMVVGAGLSLVHAPGTYMKSVDNWTKMVHASEGEFKNLIPQNYALGQEMAGNGNSLRDALKLKIFNTDPSTLDEQGKRELADAKNQLLYSTNLDRVIRQANLDPKNIKDLYQAHNLALADQHDYLSEQAAKEGNKSLSDIYKNKAKDYRSQAEAAAGDQAKFTYLVNGEGHPIFMSDRSFKTLEQEGTIAKWQLDGTIQSVNKSDNPEFAQRYKDFVTAKDQATVEGTDIIDHAKNIIEENKDRLGIHYAMAKSDPEAFLKMVSDQAFGVTADGRPSNEQNAEKAAREYYGDDIVDTAKLLYPITEKEGGPNATTEGQGAQQKSNQPSGEQEHTRTGAPREEETKSRSDRGDSGTDGAGQIAPEDNITVSEMLDKKGTYRGQRGTFTQDGQAVIFKVDNSNREYELGNINEVGQRGIHEFGIDQEKSVVDTNEAGNIVVRGKEYLNKYSDPLAAINYDKDGNLVSVTLDTPDGEKRTFRGPIGEDIAYQITLKQISHEQPAFEDFINSDEVARKEMDDAGLSAPAEEKTTDDDETVPRIKIETETVTISSPIKTESDEKAKEAEKTENVEDKEGSDKQKSMKGQPPTPPSPPVPPRVPNESPKEEFTAVRKEKNAEIKGAKELFERQKVVKWTETYDSALANVQAMYPDKGLYEAMKSRVNEFLAKWDAGELFNPTSEDIAVFNVLKNETMRRMNEIPGWDSNDNIQRMAAVAEFTVLQNDLLNVAKVTNPKGEAGRAFNLLQSEIAQDPDYGLQIRRMELLGAKGGGKLTQEDLDFTADNWQKERALIERENELKKQGMQDKFDNELAKVKADYEKRLKEAKVAKKPSEKEKREKLLSEKGAELAAKIRAGKLKGTYATFPGVPQAINLVLEGIAQLVEKGSTLAEAISEYIKSNNIKNRDKFQNDLFEVFNKQEQQEDSYDKIKKLAESTGTTDVTNDMVGKNLIRDYINSHVGLHDHKDVLDIAHASLKEILPSLDKDRLREAYLKQGEFKQPTKKELESGFKQSQKNFERLTAIEKDIADLKQKGDLFKKSSNKASPYDKDIEAKEKEKKTIMDSMGIKTSVEDKYKKGSYDQRAKSHNDRVDAISSAIQDKIDKVNLSDKTQKSLIKLKNQLDASKITLDPTSALSQERTLDGGLALFKSIKSEFQRTTSDDISKIGDINRGLQRIVDGFGKDKDESEQDIKLQRAKDKAKRDLEMFSRKISTGEYEDAPIVELSKTDAELIKLERQRGALSQLYRDRQEEYNKAAKPWRIKVGQFLRAAEVFWLLKSPVTAAKVLFSGLTKPTFEAITKLTFGKGFEALPLETTKAISERAKLGGESQSLKSIAKSYEAQFRHIGEEKLKKKVEEANDRYEKSNTEYVDQQKEVNRLKYIGMDKPEYKEAVKKLADLKNKRDSDLIDAIGNSMYQYISGSSLKEAWEVFLHRSATIERQFGDFGTEGWKKLDRSTALDNLEYLMNFTGRSHAALKNFSARAEFASGFIARLEGAVRDGVDISKPEKILEIAHESYLNWDRGKYQESNWVSDTWGKWTRATEKISPELAFLMKADVAITRVPVNMIREAVMEYSIGAIRGSVMAAREYYKAKNIVLKDGYTPENEEDFKTELREQLNKIDPQRAATILRAFRKGGFGLGMYALAATGYIAFGGFAHKGQTAEDKKKALREQDTGVPEIKTSEIQLGDYKLPLWVSQVIEHTSAFQPALFATGLAQVYHNNIIDGKTTTESAAASIYAHLDHIVGSIPQAELIGAMTAGIVSKVKPSGQWDDVDQDGNPMKRKSFHISDYLNYLPGYGNKKDILSEAYYKEAVKAQTDYRNAITEVETNTSLSKQDKEDQRRALLKELDETIDEIYKENKENPQ